MVLLPVRAAVAVASANTPTNAARKGLKGSPKLVAVASPKLKPSSTRAIGQATALANSHTLAINASAFHFAREIGDDAAKFRAARKHLREQGLPTKLR